MKTYTINKTFKNEKALEKMESKKLSGSHVQRRVRNDDNFGRNGRRR